LEARPRLGQWSGRSRILPLLWADYIDELRYQRQLSERTIKAYSEGWKSFRSAALVNGWRMRLARDITVGRIVEWQKAFVS